MKRRTFLANAGSGLLAAGALATLSRKTMAAEPPVRLKKAVKYSMIHGKTDLEKFELAKKCGFEGVELDSPNKFDSKLVLEARDKTGIPIHGIIDSIHWGKPLSSPDEKVRAEGLEGLKTAIRDAKTYGAETVLLVPGVVNKDVTYEQCFERSAIEVRKVIDMANDAKIKIGIETVWNNFITKPEHMIDYVDQFKTDTIGAYFDVSNMLKYGVSSAEWIRKIGKRLVKIDCKGYSTEKKPDGKEKGWCEIGEGTEDWPEVLKALAEVGYKTWLTAEVGGGGEERLMKISAQMDKVLMLK